MARTQAAGAARPRVRSAGHAAIGAADRAAARLSAAARMAAADVVQRAAARTATASPREIAALMLVQDGWGRQFSCLDALWGQESGWSVDAVNPSSGAYGIPQALPGPRMAAAGANWQSNAATQIRWGLGYIRALYGSPCAAWSHEEADGWY